MIIITGASRGIGYYLLHKFLNENEKVIGLYNKTKPLDLNDNNYFKADITDENEILQFVARKRDDLNNIVLLNFAGINYSSFAHKSDSKLWQQVIAVNLIGTFLVIKNLLPIMREQGYGRIINASSVLAQKGIPGTSAYAASKAALSGLAKSIAVENASKDITINNLNLGYFDIGMIHEVTENVKEMILANIPTGSFGKPEVIFNAVRFLIEADYMTGSSIDINGGLF